jgi:hypothetical protein
MPPNDIASRIGFCYEGDSHIPELTVKETLGFVSELSWPTMAGPKGSSLQDLYEEARPGLVGMVVAQSMRDMGIDNVADTVVGGDLLRGVSGGQKKRVTVGEVSGAPSPHVLFSMPRGHTACPNFLSRVQACRAGRLLLALAHLHGTFAPMHPILIILLLRSTPMTESILFQRCCR